MMIEMPQDVCSLLEPTRAYLTSEVAQILSVNDTQARTILSKKEHEGEILKHKFRGRTYWAIKPQ